jgi:hypothetical protein
MGMDAVVASDARRSFEDGMRAYPCPGTHLNARADDRIGSDFDIVIKAGRRIDQRARMNRRHDVSDGRGW